MANFGMTVKLLVPLILMQLFKPSQLESFLTGTRKYNRMIIIQITEVEYSTYRDSEGNCCDDEENDECGECDYKGVVSQSVKGKEDEKHVLFEKKVNDSTSFGRPTFTDFFASSKITEHLLTIDNGNSTTVLEAWLPVSSENIMEYKMTGTYGMFGNIRIYGYIRLAIPLPYLPHRSLYIYLASIMFSSSVGVEYEDCRPSPLTPYGPHCHLGFEGETKKNLFLQSTFAVNYEYAKHITMLKMGTSSNNQDLFKENATIVFSLFKYMSGNKTKIDKLTLNLGSVLPTLEVDLFNLVSKNSLFQLNLTFIYHCNEFSGLNCKFDCSIENLTYYCDPKTGERYCRNGGSVDSKCKEVKDVCQRNPCLNGGTCYEMNNEFYCQCQEEFTGMFCEKPKCDTTIHMGVCDTQGNIICHEEYFGKFCQFTNCTFTDHRCNSHEICVNIRGEDTCTCPETIKGLKCVDPVDVDKCEFGTFAGVHPHDKTKSRCICTIDNVRKYCDFVQKDFSNNRLLIAIIVLALLIFATLKCVIVQIVLLLLNLKVFKGSLGTINE